MTGLGFSLGKRPSHSARSGPRAELLPCDLFRNIAKQNCQVFRAGIGMNFHYRIRDDRDGSRNGPVRCFPWRGGIPFSKMPPRASGKTSKNVCPRISSRVLPKWTEGRVVDVGEMPFPVNGEEAVGDAVHDNRQPVLGFVKLRRALRHPLLKVLSVTSLRAASARFSLSDVARGCEYALYFTRLVAVNSCVI